MKRKFADLLAVPPVTWGARGDPYLWEELRLLAIENNIPLPESIENLVKQLHNLFEDLTGHSVLDRDWFFVEKYAHGGMSSGHVEPSGWREDGEIFDYIQQSFIRINMIENR
jgi:hypothetical protein